MGSTYRVAWQMFGWAEVQADSPEEAQQVVSEGCMGWSGDDEWRRSGVDGADIQAAEVTA